ncbi:hypothetical protein BC939DRAFT_434420 [Gamsiella multidivaricata]|uniref:uncharacterized protein n=1 Tax=Gamsiella multidivaricata TaxID=101098 RepID=UPI00221F5EE1|nr:uncharacterized protein BC939DRAFT_434420 [Gamsiella multidivaricata]KAG0371345.1 hypothetical protein BGZ54_005469 [Gamsiella multidivaricata]KAI7832811.1 hypothetical protein BC939DRAFT_434420 [Gamsiella multidivaricata]
MPSRTPFSFTPSSSTSSSASSSFVPYSGLSTYNLDLSTATGNSSSNPGSTSSATVMAGLADLVGLASLGEGRPQSLGSSLTSSRDEHDQISYTPIYPSYSSSFSNSSLELHESLLLAIRERQQQQLLQLRLQQQQHQQQQQQEPRADSSPLGTIAATAIASDFHSAPADHSFDISRPYHPIQQLPPDQRDPSTAASSPTVDNHEAEMSPMLTSPPVHSAEGIASIAHGALTTSAPNLEDIIVELPVSTILRQDSLFNAAPAVLEPGLDQYRDREQDRIYGHMVDQSLGQESTQPLEDSWPLQPPLLLAQPLAIDEIRVQPQFDRSNSAFEPSSHGTGSSMNDSINGEDITNSEHRRLPSTFSLDDLAIVPRATLPRRRYATRDYSSGSVSSDDWLRHPDVVAFISTDNATSPPTAESAVQRGRYEVDTGRPDTMLENQENIPPQPDHGLNPPAESTPDISIGYTPTIPLGLHGALTETPHTPDDPRQSVLPTDGNVEQEAAQILRDQEPGNNGHSEMGRIMESLAVDPTLDTVISTDVPTVSDEDSGFTLVTGTLEASENNTTTRLGLEIMSGATQSDRQGLLGPLLSSTQTTRSSRSASTSAALPPPSEDTLDFSLLGSTRSGLDSSILSMASRIRQARLTRLLRLMNERDTAMGYPERYPWNRFAQTDTRSMLNHASGSRGTSQADSLEDGHADLGQEADSQDTVDEGRNAAMNRDRYRERFLPVHCPSFAEILDRNGNSIEWSRNRGSSSDSSSYASSIASHEAIEEEEQRDDEWTSSSVDRQRSTLGSRRNRAVTTTARMERFRSDWNRGGIICGHGRSRVMSTGTVFEGMEHISEADSLLEEQHLYQSLKAPWATNPNGESWSDDDEDGEGPQRRRHGVGAAGMNDADDKDQQQQHATGFMRRSTGSEPSLGVLQAGFQNSSSVSNNGGVFYIYGNVRNRYGPESARRQQRVISELTDLLRREQEWERVLELEQYNREMAMLRPSNTSSNPPTAIGSGGASQNQRRSSEDEVPEGTDRSSLLEGQDERRRRRSQSLYVDFEGGTLRPEERWRRGKEEMIGR